MIWRAIAESQPRRPHLQRPRQPLDRIHRRHPSALLDVADGRMRHPRQFAELDEAEARFLPGLKQPRPEL